MNNVVGWSKAARYISEEEWIERINRIPDEAVRAKVSNLVWCDFIGDFPVGQRSAYWGQYINKPLQTLINVPDEEVAAGLVAIGYPEDQAVRRACSDKHESNNDLGARRASGSESVLCALCEKAFEDLRELVKRGVVLPNGQIHPAWPPRNHNGVVGYMGRAEVQQLIDWVLGGDMYDFLTGLGIDRDFNIVLKRMGLEHITGDVA